MKIGPARNWLAITLLFAGALLLWSQDWQNATALPGVDFSGLTPAMRQHVLHVLRDYDCSCGCAMKVAECRFKDPACAYSKGLSAVVVASIRQGKSEAAAIADAKASRFGHRPEPKLLDDPVPIPTQGAPVMGPAAAPVTLVEFSDFQCPYCAIAVAKINAILKAYPRDVKLVFKQFPLDSHPQAAISAQASLAAQKQGKFWQLHDVMYAHRTELSRRAILGWAAALGLDMKKFEADLDSDAVKKTVARDMDDGEKAGVEGTPTVYINGRRYNGDLELSAVKPVIEAELKRVAAARK
ncbi:MAG: thioredoxin domain-containing protein [Acidobacteria bacterium]|nr:thioredoxin domain-containing protein [Acidobacteriota bacterium]